MARAAAEKTRQPGTLRLVTKRSKGKEYRSWQWRTHRRTDTGWTTVDVELGEYINTTRTRVLVALGELSAPLLLERYARYTFKYIQDLPAWSGRPPEARSRQRAAWWLELPSSNSGAVRLRFRNLKPVSCVYDFRRRFHREEVELTEKIATIIWRSLTDDPILRLAEIQWLIAEMTQQIDRCSDGLMELRRQRRRGGINQRDFEADERFWLKEQDQWETHRSDLERVWDQRLDEMVKAMPRARREADRMRILSLAEKLLADGRQQQRWRSDHWDGNTLTWRV